VASIRLESVSKQFGDVDAVKEVNLDVADGEFIVLVGPSGCGKTTLLRLVAGLDDVTGGRIYMDDRELTEIDPGERDVAMVFQNYALYPTMNVRQNIGFGLFVRGTDKGEMRRQVEDVARVLNVESLLDRKPQALSGGQRQRVAMARALVRNPRAFLMDEPLSNLDARLRVSMRAELSRLHEQVGTTTVYVTHDQIEAMTLGQRVAVLQDGELQQVDTPRALFERPANLFVAGFMGSPSMNLVPAKLSDGRASFGGYSLDLGSVAERLGEREVILGMRPVHFAVAGGSSDPGLPRMRVRVEVVEDLGTELNLVFFVDAPQAGHHPTAGGDRSPEDRLLRDDRNMFTAQVDARSRVEVGDEIELVVDTGQAHLFDPATERSLLDGREPIRQEAAP
jgi:multiple sugar transport system ATP-binding protein